LSRRHVPFHREPVRIEEAKGIIYRYKYKSAGTGDVYRYRTGRLPHTAGGTTDLGQEESYSNADAIKVEDILQ
jgi:hypothetical protein